MAGNDDVRPRARLLIGGLVAALAVPLALVTAPATSGASVATSTAEGTAEWTMMLYAVADTQNIGTDMAQDLIELAQVPDDPETNIVVLVDMPAPTEVGAPFEGQVLPGLGQFTTAKLLTLEGGRYEEIRDLGEISMGRPDTLAAFIAEAAERFPAEHYGLTLMDHGGANLGGYLDVAPETRLMTVPEIRNGMVAGMQQAGIDRFDVLYHSACLMSNYETASALGPLAEFMAGSEELMYVFAMLPPAGFTTAQEAGTGEAIGRAFLDAYVQRIEQEHVNTPEWTEDLKAIRDLVALSVIEGDGASVLDLAMQSFSRAAVANMDEIVNSVARARADALEFMINVPGGGTSADLVDLGDFLAHLQDLPDEVAVARDAVHAALRNAVSYQVTGRGTSQATGLSVYLPTTDENVGAYLSDGTAPSGWREFVEAFLAASAASGSGQQGTAPAQFVTPEAQVVQSDSTGIKIAGQLVSGGSAAVVEQETQVYTRMGDQPDALALVLPAYLDAGGEGVVQGVWNHALTVLSDGDRTVPATTMYQAQEGGLNGAFLAQYTSPEGDVTEIGVRVLLSSEGAIQSVSTFAMEGNGAAGVTVAIGGRLTPYVFVPSAESFVQTLSSQSIPVTERLVVDFARLPTDTRFDMGVVVGDAAGNYDGAFVSSRVP